MAQTVIKPGAGRPAQLKDGRYVSVYLAASEIAQAKQLGDGNVSKGVRLAMAEMKSPKG